MTETITAAFINAIPASLSAFAAIIAVRFASKSNQTNKGLHEVSQGQLEVARSQLEVNRGQLELAQGQATIEKRQIEIENMRLKMELYDKRYKIFAATKRYMNFVSKDFKISIEEIQRFLNDSVEIDFLFDIELLEYVDELRAIAFKLRSNAGRIEQLRERNDLTGLEPLFDNDNELTRKFVELNSQLIEKFKPYLGLTGLV